jgi:cell division protein FtsB
MEQAPENRKSASRRVASGMLPRNRRVVQEQLGRLQMPWRFTLVTLLVSLAAIIWLSQTSTLVSLGYRIGDMEREMIVLNRDAEQLRSQIAQYENPVRVEEIARTKLGMVQATKVVYVKVPAGPVRDARNSTDARLYPINAWWRELRESLPQLNKP